MHYKYTNTLTYASAVHIIHKVDIFNAYGLFEEKNGYE